jgi:hypothetical protein
MQDKKRHSIHKRIHEVDATKNYSGEASPYWDHLFATQDTTGEGMHVREDALANPDVLSEDDALTNRPLTPDGELRMQAVHETVAELTDHQRKILGLLFDGVWSDEEGQRVYTEQAIAEAVGSTRVTIQVLIRRIKIKIRRRYEKLKAAKE